MKPRSVYHFHNRQTLSKIEGILQRAYASFTRRELELLCFNTDTAYSQTLHEVARLKALVEQLEARGKKESA